MNSDIQVFNYQNKNIRTINIDGEIWFVAKDIADILEIKNARDAVSGLDEDEKGTEKIRTPGGMQDMTIINEYGLYSLTLRSNKPEAKHFKHWITHDVLPAIRKTGFYATPDTAEKILNDPYTFIQILQAYKHEKEKSAALEAHNKQLTNKVELDKPKVIFAEAVETSNDSILIRDLAKLLRQNGYKTGEKRLFAELRNKGFLIKSGSDYNMPTQKSMELGVMEILERSINRGNGENLVKRTPKITGHGQVYFINLFLDK